MVIATDSPKPVSSPTAQPLPDQPRTTDPSEGHRYSVPQLVTVLREQIQAQGNGQLLLRARDGRCWSLHIRVGRLFWANSSEQRQRRWQRQLKLHGTSLPNLPPMISGEGQWLREHQVLTQVVRRQLLPRRTVVTWIEATIIEVLFDIFQAAMQLYPPEASQEPGQREEPIAILNNSDLFRHAQEQLINWNTLGLQTISPNQTPIARNIQALQKETPPKTFKALSKLLLGEAPLRDLASVTQQDLLVLGRLLGPYIKANHVTFQPIGDLNSAEAVVSPKSTATSLVPQQAQPTLLIANRSESIPEPKSVAPADAPIAAADPIAAIATAAMPDTPSPNYSVPASIATPGPLVLCVDDSTQIAYILEQILQPAGYRFLSVQDPIDALSMILRNKPDIILLDLIMPMVYGHEICTQLRRSPLFKATPIIMITSNPTIVDKAVKGAGATDYLLKPFDETMLLQTLQRYVPTPKP